MVIFDVMWLKFKHSKNRFFMISRFRTLFQQITGFNRRFQRYSTSLVHRNIGICMRNMTGSLMKIEHFVLLLITSDVITSSRVFDKESE